MTTPTVAEGNEVAVVIPAYYGARTIAGCLEAVSRATKHRRCEIIVVESSGDETAEIIRTDFPDVTLIASATRLTAGGARNRGAQHAKADLIFFTDQDCLVPEDWIDRLEKHLRQENVGAAGGSVGVANIRNMSGWAVYFLEFLTHFPVRRRPERNGNFLVGCNSGYRASVLRGLGFPDQTLGEDVLFSRRIQEAGFDVVYDPGIEVLHHNRQGWGEFFAYNRKMGQSAAAYHRELRRWWIGPFFRFPVLTFVAPLVILPTVAMRLLRARWLYLTRFLLLAPMCLAGNLVWAAAFRREVRRARQFSV